jgi:hypothetical protein
VGRTGLRVRFEVRVTVENDNGKPRLQRRRLRDVSRPSSTTGEPPRAERRHRTANRSLLLQARRIAGELGVRSEGGEGATAPGAAQELAREALRVFRAFARELGTVSPTARSHALAFAMQSAAAQRLTFSAAAAGLDTPHGLQLLEQAARCQGRAERSAIAAITLAGLLDRRAPEANAALARILAAGSGKEPTS